MKLAALAAAALLTATACSSSSSSQLTAEQVTRKLAEKIPSISLTKTYTAEDDPNHQLGRPNGYTSKTAFADARIPPDQRPQDNTEIENGGSIEVFSSSADAQTRKDYIQKVTQPLGGLLTEYDYVKGAVLVRVSKLLTPDQAKEYETALDGIG